MIAIQATCINTNFSFQVNTIVFPLKSMTGSSSFPVEYAKVQSAYADLSSQPVKSLYRPDKKLIHKNPITIKEIIYKNHKNY